MKSFNDFLATLSAKDQEETLKAALAEMPGEKFSYSADEMKLIMKTATVTAFFTREMLRRYHSWLAEQIDSSTP